jgi:hypothetical protein
MFFSLSSRNIDGCAKLTGTGAEAWKVVECPVCRARVDRPAGLVTVAVVPKTKGGKCWPDISQSDGRVRGLCISRQVKDCLDMEGYRYGVTLPVAVAPPFPKGLVGSPPEYCMVLGELGACFDFEKAGMTVHARCLGCGRVEREAKSPLQKDFVRDTWNGMEIFITDLSPYSFYCTERVVELARRHRWTGFCFIPLEQAHDYTHPGIDYLSE